ncbi:heterokaryon incompatibility protein-domain-containing protein [Xylariaceae sp. FL1019]|nr:heterokaryon incompatibility protein-domain-containing protein [Xylariaceae sp. FL1019]
MHLQQHEIDALFRPYPIEPDTLCSQCSSIDWYHLATTRLDDEGHEVFPVVHNSSRLERKRCSICRMIAPMVYDDPDHVSVHLNIRPASALLSTWSSKQVMVNRLRNSNLLYISYKPGDHLERSDFVGLTYPGQQFDFGVQPMDCASVDFPSLKQCLDYCQTQHMGRCDPITGDKPRNLRLIDCRSKRLKIILAPPACHYVALSYVWGNQSLAPRKKPRSFAFLSYLKRRNDVELFPQVVKDSIQAVVALGFDYLWVDQFCINQNDPVDKQQQIAQMDKIFANAACTIAAAAGEDSTYGLPGVSRPRKKQQQLTIKSGVTFIGNTNHFYLPTVRSVWSKRGWTLQESFLSSRRIFFTDRGTYFLCNSRQAVEGIKQPLHVPRQEERFNGYVLEALDAPERSLKELEILANSLLEQYGGRQLTYASDKLGACLGMLNVLQRSGLFLPWGLPLLQDGRDPTKLSMDWFQNRQHCRTGIALERVPRVPSWSSLGWYGSSGVVIGRYSEKHERGSPYIYFGDIKRPLLSLDQVANQLKEGRMSIDSCPRYLHLTGLFLNVSFVKMAWMEPLPWREPDDYVYHNTKFTRSSSGRQVEVTFPPYLDYPYASLPLADNLRVWFNYSADTEQPTSDQGVIGLLLGSFSYTEDILREAYALLKAQDSLYDFLHPHSNMEYQSQAHSAAKAIFGLNKVLLLKDHGEYYERIGLFDLPIQETKEGRHGRFGFCNDARERIVTVDLQDYTLPLWLKEAWVQSVVIG